jgi:pilus assembly protein CpaE
MLADLVPLLSQNLPLTPLTEMNHYPDRAALAEIVGAKPPSLTFLDMATNQEYGFCVLHEVSQLAPNVPVVVLLNANDPDLILRCLRQGATEFLLQPLSTEQLHPVLERLSQAGPNPSYDSGGGKVVTVMPVKGACGSSTIATNLAFQWKRNASGKILLADMDPSTGTISFLLKVKSNYSFMDALSRAGTLDSDLWKGLVASVAGIDVLLSPENPVDGTQDLPDPGSVIEFCRQAYASVVLDCGGAYGAWPLSLANHCDELMLVTTNELPALRATQRVLQTFDRLRIERAKIRLVVNRYHPDVGLSQEAIETALHIDVHHVIPSDYEAVQKALVEGKPVAPNSSFGKSLIALADRVSGGPGGPGNGAVNGGAPRKKGSGWASLFSSFVSKVTN